MQVRVELLQSEKDLLQPDVSFCSFKRKRLFLGKAVTSCQHPPSQSEMLHYQCLCLS